MRQVVKRVSLAQPSPIQIDSTEPDVIRMALEQIPGRAIVNSVNLEAGRDKLDTVVPLAIEHGAAVIALTIDEVGMAKTAAAQGRDRPAHQGAGLRRARPRSRAADLRPADLHADHRRRGVAPVGGRDDRGHPPAQAGAAAGQDLARRLERLLRRLPHGARGAQLGLPAPLRRGRARPRDGQPQPHHAVRRDHRGRARAGRRPRLQPPRGRARALHRPLRVQGRGGGRRGRRPDGRHGARGGAALAHPAAQEGRRGGLDRPLGREDRRRPDPQRGAAAGDEGGRRQVRRRRAHPPLRAAERGGHEARRGAARALPRQARGLHEGHRRRRHRLRRRARHRQVAGQHDPHQQRLHGHRPRQAGPDRDDHRGGQGARRDGDRAQRAARLDLQADAAVHPGAPQRGPRVPRAHRRRGDQPRLRPARAVPAAGASPTRSTSPASSTARTPSRAWPRWTSSSTTRRARRSWPRRARPRQRLRDKGPEPEQGDTTDASVRSAARTDAPVPEPPFWGAREIDVDDGRGLPPPRHPRALQAALGRARREGRGVAQARRRGLPPAPGAHVARGRLPAPAGQARLLPLLQRGQRGRRARPRGPRDGARAPRLPAPAQARPHLPGRLLPPEGAAASSTSSRCRRSPPATRSPS